MRGKKILVDFESGLTSPTGIPITTTNDVLALLEAGFEVGLWYSKYEKTLLIEEWMKSEPRFPSNAKLHLENSRPENWIIWIFQFFQIKISIQSYDYFYCSLFPGIRLNPSTIRIIRMHDPYSRHQNPIMSLFEFGARYKLRIANFLRSVALNRVASDSIFIFNSEYTQSRALNIYPSIKRSLVIYPSLQFQPSKKLPVEDSNVPPYWLMIGGQRQRKKPATILNLWAECDQLSESNFQIIGGVPMELLNSAAITALRNGRLQFHQNLSSEDVYKRIVNSIGTVFYSFGEGWGLPIAESLSCGKLTICNDLPVFKEVAGSHAQYFSTSHPEKALEIMQKGLLGMYDGDGLIQDRRKFAERYQTSELSKLWRRLPEMANQ